MAKWTIRVPKISFSVTQVFDNMTQSQVDELTVEIPDEIVGPAYLEMSKQLQKSMMKTARENMPPVVPVVTKYDKDGNRSVEHLAPKVAALPAALHNTRQEKMQVRPVPKDSVGNILPKSHSARKPTSAIETILASQNKSNQKSAKLSSYEKLVMAQKEVEERKKAQMAHAAENVEMVMPPPEVQTVDINQTMGISHE